MARPAVVVRYAGLLGAVCCAIDGFLFGASRQMRLGVTVASILRGPHGELIMLLWLVGLAVLCAAWWYGRRLTVSTRWVLITAALWIIPFLIIPPLASRDMYAYACQGASVAAGLDPYQQPISALPCPWLESVSPVWRDTPTPYGPVTLILAGGAAAPGSLGFALGAFRAYAVLALVLLAAALVALARRLDVPADRALWWVLCCPLVPVHLVGGGHNDAIVVAFLVAGLAFIASPAADQKPAAGQRPAAGPGRRMGWLAVGGSLIGLAIAVKASAGIVLPFAALLAAGGSAILPAGGLAAVRAGGLAAHRAGLVRLVRRGGVVVAAALVAVLACSYASGFGLGWVGALSGPGRSVSWTSPPTAVGVAIDAVGKWFGAHLGAVPVVRWVALAALPIVLVLILWRTWRDSPLYGAGVACVASIVLAPITQPWYLVWPLVLFVAALDRVRWFAVLVVASMFTILPDGDGVGNPIQVPLSFAMTALAGWAAYHFVGWLRAGRAREAGQIRRLPDDRRPSLSS